MAVLLYTYFWGRPNILDGSTCTVSSNNPYDSESPGICQGTPFFASYIPHRLQGALKKQAYNKVVQQERMWVMIPYLLCCRGGDYRICNGINHLQGARKKHAYNKVVQQKRMWVMTPYLLYCRGGDYRRRS